MKLNKIQQQLFQQNSSSYLADLKNTVRALNPAAWYMADTGVTVTGQGVSTLADQSGNGRDLLQGTDASRPPYLSYSGTKYLYLPGAAGNYASTPDSVANSITGDIDIRVRVALDDWTPATSNRALCGKYVSTGNQRAYLFEVKTTGPLIFYTSTDGTATVSAESSSATGFTDGTAHWLRVTRSSASGDVIFYTADDSSSPPSSWTKLGNTISTAAGGIFDSTAIVEAGAQTAGASDALGPAKFYRAIIKNGIDGTTVVDFNPDLDASDASTSFSSSATGETWTVNSSGGLPAQIVGRSSILFDGTADYLKTNAFTLNQPTTVYLAFKQVSWTNSDHIFDGNGSDSGVLYQTNLTPNIVLYAGTANAATNGGLAVGAYGAVCAVINGASSLIQVGLGTATTGNPGASNMGGFTLGAIGAGSSSWANIQFLEGIIFPTAHDATQRALIALYFKLKYGITF